MANTRREIEGDVIRGRLSAIISEIKLGDVLHVLGNPNMLGEDREEDDLALHAVTVTALPDISEIRDRYLRTASIQGTISSDLFGNEENVRQLWENSIKTRSETWEQFKTRLMTHEVWLEPIGMHEGCMFKDEKDARRERLNRMRKHAMNLAEEILTISRKIKAEETRLETSAGDHVRI